MWGKRWRAPPVVKLVVMVIDDIFTRAYYILETLRSWHSWGRSHHLLCSANNLTSLLGRGGGGDITRKPSVMMGHWCKSLWLFVDKGWRWVRKLWCMVVCRFLLDSIYLDGVFIVCADYCIGMDSSWLGNTLSKCGRIENESLSVFSWSVVLDEDYVGGKGNHISWFHLRVRVTSIKYKVLIWVAQYLTIFHDSYGAFKIGSSKTIWIARVNIDIWWWVDSAVKVIVMSRLCVWIIICIVDCHCRRCDVVCVLSRLVMLVNLCSNYLLWLIQPPVYMCLR